MRQRDLRNEFSTADKQDVFDDEQPPTIASIPRDEENISIQKGFWEMEGDTLTIFGTISDALDMKTNLAANHIIFARVDFDRILAAIPKLKKMLRLVALTIKDSNCTMLHQLNGLGELRTVSSLTLLNAPICESVCADLREQLLIVSAAVQILLYIQVE